VSVALGIALGSVVGLLLFPYLPRLAFVLGGLVTLLGVGLAWRGVPQQATSQVEEKVDTPPRLPWRTGLLSFGTAWVQGFLEGGTLTFLSIYLLALGHPETTVSALMGGLFAGVVLAQLPVAWLADQFGRLRILLACHALVLAGLASVPLTTSLIVVAGWLFLLGACCGALYPLGLALLGERIETAGLARANAWYLASNCAGSLSGPVVIGLVIDGFGLAAQFATGAVAVLAVLLAWAVVPLRVPATTDQSGRRAA
jgi:MFS family permease